MFDEFMIKTVKGKPFICPFFRIFFTSQAIDAVIRAKIRAINLCALGLLKHTSEEVKNFVLCSF